MSGKALKFFSVLLALAMATVIAPVPEMSANADSITISVIELAYDADIVAPNVSWTEKEAHWAAIYMIGSHTEGLTNWTDYARAMSPDSEGKWDVIDGREGAFLDADTVYGMRKGYILKEGYVFPPSVMNNSANPVPVTELNGFTVKVNGEVRTDLIVMYDTTSVHPVLEIVIPFGKPSTGAYTPYMQVLYVTEASISLERGDSYTFKPNPYGIGLSGMAYSWEVSGGSSAATVISADGKLTVGSDETSPELTVTLSAGSLTATAKVTVSDVPLSIDSVEVKLDREVQRPGDQAWVTAIVTGTHNNKAVTWSLTGNDSADTTLKDEGGMYLRVAEDETSSMLTITATSVADPTKSGKLDIPILATVSIKDAVVTGIEESYEYTGSAIEPVPVVKLGDVTLTAGKDYTVSYGLNINTGTATVFINGTGGYSGQTSKRFMITAVKVPVPEGKWLIYNGNEQTGVAANDKYYTVSGNTAKEIGEYTAKLVLKNKPNYTWPDGTTADMEVKWAIVSGPTPEPTTPGPGETTPAPDTTTPVPGETTPAPGTTTPVPGETTPAPGTTTPVPGETTPAPGTTTPVPGETTPVPGTTTPVPTDPTPTPAPVAVTSIKLSADFSDLYMKRSGGGYLQLEVQTVPANADVKSVTWASDKPKRASVDGNGLVTAVKKGKTVITVTVVDAYGKTFTAKCEVTVKKNTKKVTKVKLDRKTVTLRVGESFKPTVTLKPATAYEDIIKWKSSNKKIAKVAKDGTITARKKGTCKITATSKSGKKATIKVKVKK